MNAEARPEEEPAGEIEMMKILIAYGGTSVKMTRERMAEASDEEGRTST
jgi:hypothetical protein